MVNCIEGGTNLLFSTSDKTQKLGSYRGLNLASMALNHYFRQCTDKKSIFSKT